MTEERRTIGSARCRRRRATRGARARRLTQGRVGAPLECDQAVGPHAAVVQQRQPRGLEVDAVNGPGERLDLAAEVRTRLTGTGRRSIGAPSRSGALDPVPDNRLYGSA